MLKLCNNCLCFINRYQGKKAKGEIPPRNISCLPKQKKEKRREEWRQTKAKNRKKKKDLAAILDMTPPSPEGLVYGSPVHGSPSLSPISSPSILSTISHNLPLTHPPSNRRKKTVCQAKLRAKVKKLEKENMTLKSELDGHKKSEQQK